MEDVDRRFEMLGLGYGGSESELAEGNAEHSGIVLTLKWCLYQWFKHTLIATGRSTILLLKKVQTSTLFVGSIVTLIALRQCRHSGGTGVLSTKVCLLRGVPERDLNLKQIGRYG